MDCENLDVHVAADYICWKFFKLDENISVTKLHKLLYLVQAWYLAKFDKALFKDDFEAWVHGPVCPAIEDRFKMRPKALPLNASDIDLERLNKNIKHEHEDHICHVLEHYGELSFLKLEEYFKEHETPWIEARSDMSSLQRSNAIIDKDVMRQFHREK